MVRTGQRGPSPSPRARSPAHDFALSRGVAWPGYRHPPAQLFGSGLGGDHLAAMRLLGGDRGGVRLERPAEVGEMVNAVVDLGGVVVLVAVKGQVETVRHALEVEPGRVGAG